MGHHRKNIPGGITDAGNISKGSVRISIRYYAAIFIAIPENHLVICFQFVKEFFIGVVTALAVSDGNLINVFTAVLYKNILTDKLLICISQKNSWQ